MDTRGGNELSRFLLLLARQIY